MDEFNKFSIEELNQTIFVLDEFQKKNSPDPSLQNLQNLIENEIERRTNIGNNISLDELKEKFLGKYVRYVSDDQLLFRIDEIIEDNSLGMVYFKSKLVIIEYSDGYICIQYTSEPSQTVNINPNNFDLKNFIISSPEEFNETLNKIIKNGLA